MRRLSVVLLCAAAGCAPAARSEPPIQAPTQAPTQAPAAADEPAAEPAPPPTVLSGSGRLECVISSSENGHQKLVLNGGQGLEFDVVVSPIVDGVVNQKGPKKGGSYRFTSHLAEPGTGKLSGVGDVAIDELETKVSVEMARYQQPGGAGTELTFQSEDMLMRGIYVEFSGKAHAGNDERFAFRITLGAPGPGSGGSVKPASPADSAPIYSKAVTIQAPAMTVVTTNIQKIP